MKKTIAIAICALFIMPANAQNSTPSKTNEPEEARKDLRDADDSLGSSLKDLTKEMSSFENILKRRQKTVNEGIRRAKVREALNKKKGVGNSTEKPSNSAHPPDSEVPFPIFSQNRNALKAPASTSSTPAMPTTPSTPATQRANLIKKLQALHAQRKAVDPGSQQYADLTRKMGQLQMQLGNINRQIKLMR